MCLGHTPSVCVCKSEVVCVSRHTYSLYLGLNDLGLVAWTHQLYPHAKAPLPLPLPLLEVSHKLDVVVRIYVRHSLTLTSIHTHIYTHPLHPGGAVKCRAIAWRGTLNDYLNSLRFVFAFAFPDSDSVFTLDSLLIHCRVFFACRGAVSGK